MKKVVFSIVFALLFVCFGSEKSNALTYDGWFSKTYVGDGLYDLYCNPPYSMYCGKTWFDPIGQKRIFDASDGSQWVLLYADAPPSQDDFSEGVPAEESLEPIEEP